MKKGRLFAKIIYYGFTFLLGLVLALTLPNYFLYFTVPYEYVGDALLEGDYQSAMLVTGKYYDSQPVLQREFDGGGLVLFEAVMQEPSNTTKEGAEPYMLYKTYFGFLYGKRDYNILDLDASSVGSIGQLESVASDSQLAHAAAEELQKFDFSFKSDFFDKFDEFLPQYNALVSQWNDENTPSEDLEGLSKQIQKLYDDFKTELSQNVDYKVIDDYDEAYQQVYSVLRKRADKKGIVAVLIYFVCIYVLGDFLLGNFYIVKFFSWFIYDVCKVKRKNKQKLKKNEIFGNDYYSSVTVSLDLEAVPDFNESVQIKYTNTDVEIVFILLKENNYTATERIKAGVYVNPFIDINREYTTTNLPDNLEVEGYKMDLKIKIIKREV